MVSNRQLKKTRLSLSRKKALKELNTTRFGSPTKSDTFLSAAKRVFPETPNGPLQPFCRG